MTKATHISGVVVDVVRPIPGGRFHIRFDGDIDDTEYVWNLNFGTGFPKKPEEEVEEKTTLSQKDDDILVYSERELNDSLALTRMEHQDVIGHYKLLTFILIVIMIMEFIAILFLISQNNGTTI